MQVRGSAATVNPEPKSYPASTEMNTESNLLTAERFVSGWQQTHPRIRVDGIISTYKETHRLTDEWPYHLDQHGIYYQVKDETRKTDKVYVRDIIGKTGYPEEAETRVFEQVEKWAKDAEEGMAIWVSPKFPGKYPCGKVIVHEIFYELGTGEKVIRNSAILFDVGERDTLETIHRLFPQTRKFQNLEELRAVLLFPDHNFKPEMVTEAIAELDPNVRNARQELFPEELEVKAKQISDLISQGVNSRQVAYEMQRLGLLGKFSISCPTAQGKRVPFSETIGGVGIEDHYGSLQFDCPVCGFKNTRPYGKLIPNCTHCGSNVRC